MKGILLLVLLSTPATLAWSQDIATATIQWNSASTFNATAGSSTEEVTSLTTHQTSLEWKNADGSMRKSFQIIERIGDWNNVGSEGQVQYEVTDGQYSGTVSIRKSASETKILIVIASDEPTTRELVITGYQVL